MYCHAMAAATAAAAAAAAAGFSRLLLDSFPNDPVLFVTEQGPAAAAAAVLSSDQWAQMVERNLTQDPKASPGILQMLQVNRMFGCLLLLPGSSTCTHAVQQKYVELLDSSTAPCKRIKWFGAWTVLEGVARQWHSRCRKACRTVLHHSANGMAV
jgi:hypothetical protein